MRTFLKRVALIAGIGFVLAWFMAAAHIGIENRDEWYGHMDVEQESDNVPMAQCVGDEDDQPILPCAYDATTQGNGEGRSFTMEVDGSITYWDTEY